MTNRNEISHLELAIFSIALAQKEIAISPAEVDCYTSVMSDLQKRYHQLTNRYYHIKKEDLLYHYEHTLPNQGEFQWS